MPFLAEAQCAEPFAAATITAPSIRDVFHRTLAISMLHLIHNIPNSSYPMGMASWSCGVEGKRDELSRVRSVAGDPIFSNRASPTARERQSMGMLDHYHHLYSTEHSLPESFFARDFIYAGLWQQAHRPAVRAECTAACSIALASSCHAIVSSS